MSVQISTEQYLTTLKGTDWNTHLIKSTGEIVEKGSGWGRVWSNLTACRCSGKGMYSISKAQNEVMDRVIAYIAEGRATSEVEEATRSAIALAAIANLNSLVDYVKAKRPTSTLEKIELDTKNPVEQSNEVEEIDSSSKEIHITLVATNAKDVAANFFIDPAVQSSVDESGKRKRRKADDLMFQDSANITKELPAKRKNRA